MFSFFFFFWSNSHQCLRLKRELGDLFLLKFIFKGSSPIQFTIYCFYLRIFFSTLSHNNTAFNFPSTNEYFFTNIPLAFQHQKFGAHFAHILTYGNCLIFDVEWKRWWKYLQNISRLLDIFYSNLFLFYIWNKVYLVHFANSRANHN